MISELDPSDRAEAETLAPEIKICGARIRDGGSCKNPPAPASSRCRLHGGAPGSGGPVRQHNGRYVDGHYTTERKAERRLKRRLLATAKTVETGALPSPSTSGVHLAGRVRHVKANHLQAEAPEGVHHGEWLEQLRQVLGGGSEAFVMTCLSQLMDAASINRDYTPTRESFSATLELIRGLAPEDTVQAAHAVHVAQLHMAAAALNGRIILYGSTRRTNEYAVAAAKLERAFVNSLEAYQRLKRGNRQIIRIERVVEVERSE